MQPEALVPVTVYTVVVVGVTVTLVPIKLPGTHVYVLAPPAVKVAEAPLALQILVGLLTAVKVGFALTTTLTVCVFTQPFPLVPVTV